MQKKDSNILNNSKDKQITEDKKTNGLEKELEGTKSILENLTKNDEDAIEEIMAYFSKLGYEKLKALGEKERYIILLGIDENLFFRFPKKYQNDLEIAKNLILIKLKKKTKLEDIFVFIDKNFKDEDKEHLIEFFNKQLELQKNIFLSDTSKILEQIKKDNISLYDFLNKNKIIQKNNNEVSINEKLIEKIKELLEKDEELKNISDEKEKEKYKIDFLLNYLGLNSFKEDKNLSNLLKILSDFIVIKQEIKKEEDDKKDENKTKKEATKQEIKKEEQEVIDEVNFMDFSKSVYPPSNIYNYGNYYTIHTSFGNDIKFSLEEAQKFNSISFNNFMKFYNLLGELNLDFLWHSKYRDSFLSKSKIDIFSSSGISQEKTLSVLNFLAYNIGIPLDKKEDNIEENEADFYYGMTKYSPHPNQYSPHPNQYSPHPNPLPEGEGTGKEKSEKKYIKNNDFHSLKREFSRHYYILKDKYTSSMFTSPFEVYLDKEGYLKMEGGGLTSKWKEVPLK